MKTARAKNGRYMPGTIKQAWIEKEIVPTNNHQIVQT